MKITNFKTFEIAVALLEDSTPDSIDNEILTESNLTIDDLEKINESLLGDIFGGLFKKIKTIILKKIPGNILKQIDELIKDYEDTKNSISGKTFNERNKIYKASISAEDKSDSLAVKRFNEIKLRGDKTIETIENANKSKLDSIKKRMDLLIKDKSDFIKDYVELKMLEVQERIADKELKDAENNASEDILDEIEKKVKDAKTKLANAAKELEQSSKEPDKNDKKKNDKKKINIEDIKVGQEWLYKRKDGAENLATILNVPDELKKGEVHIKSKDGKEFSIKTDNLIKQQNYLKKVA